MQFKVFQKTNRSLTLWTGAVTFIWLVIGLIIIFMLSSLSMRVRVSLSIQFLFNAIFIWLFWIVINHFQALNTFCFRQVTYRNPKTKQVVKESFILNHWLYLVMVVFVIALWLLEVFSFYFWNHDWKQAFLDYWYFGLILLVYNCLFIGLFFQIKVYLLNHSDIFKHQNNH